MRYIGESTAWNHTKGTDRSGQVGEQLPVRRLEPGGDGTPEPLTGPADFAHEPVMVRNALLDDLVAQAHRIDRTDGRVEVRLLSGQEFVVLPPELGHDVLETTVLGDLRGLFDPERHGVGYQAAEPGVMQAGEFGPELLRRGRVRAGQEIEGWSWIVINPCPTCP